MRFPIPTTRTSWGKNVATNAQNGGNKITYPPTEIKQRLNPIEAEIMILDLKINILVCDSANKLVDEQIPLLLPS